VVIINCSLAVKWLDSDWVQLLALDSVSQFDPA